MEINKSIEKQIKINGRVNGQITENWADKHLSSPNNLQIPNNPNSNFPNGQINGPNDPNLPNISLNKQH